MARPRKPSNVLQLTGAFRKNPKRARARTNEPVADTDVGEPPEALPPAVAAAWQELRAMAHPGTLCAADRAFLEYAAAVMVQMRNATRAKTKKNAAIDTKLGIRFEAIIGRLGLSPADRSRVSALKGKEKADPYAEFRKPA